MYSPSDAGQSRQSLATVLHDLRKAAGLSGERLALKAHMSQSKISRIETGRILPTVADVERLLRALDVPEAQRAQLGKLTSMANVDFLSRRQVRKIGAKQHQHDLAAMFEQADHMRCLFPAMPPGFLQTEAYARSNVNQPLSRLDADRRAELIAAKVAQHKILSGGRTRFSVLFTEQAVRFPMAAADVMVEQVRHLLSASNANSAEIAILPADRVMQIPPLNTFFICDNRLVIVATHAGSMAFRDPTHVEEHLALFEYFSRHAVHGEEARDLLWVIAEDFRRRAEEVLG